MGRLKGIPAVLSPDLLHALASMGHGDEIVLADANFPSSSTAKSNLLIDASGHDALTVLKGVLELFPLDTYVDFPVAVMATVFSDNAKFGDEGPPIWAQLRKEIGGQIGMERVERFAFYERAKKAFAVVATGETAAYGNIILKKGVIN